jgi:hypothetical protein
MMGSLERTFLVREVALSVQTMMVNYNNQTALP